MKGKKYLLIILTGLILMTEHIITYGYYDFELIGHETYGLIFIILGLFSFWYKNLRIKHFVVDSQDHEDTNTDHISIPPTG